MARNHGTNSAKLLTAKLLEISVLDRRQLYGVCTVKNVKMLFFREKKEFTRYDA
jgi:hypothetical protein